MALKNYFWDSCVFISYLNNDDAVDIKSLRAFIADLDKPNGCRIYTSAIALAEVSPKRLVNTAVGTFQDFLKDFKGTIQVVDAGPYENQTAGLLKDIAYKRNGSNKRVLTTGDAIMLATALELEDTYGVKIDAFHTYDNGRGKGNPEGRGVPLLDYHLWLDGVADHELAARVVKMNRCRPAHGNPDLFANANPKSI